MKTSWLPQQIAAACREFGPQVGPLPAGVDGTQLLWAMSGVESSFGKNCTPRHEPAYDKGGVYGSHVPLCGPTGLLAVYGALGASSFGPWQVMLANVPGAAAPELFNGLEYACRVSCAVLNGMLRRLQPKSLAEIGECWNAGHVTADPAYTDRLARCYAMPMAGG